MQNAPKSKDKIINNYRKKVQHTNCVVNIGEINRQTKGETSKHTKHSAPTYERIRAPVN